MIANMLDYLVCPECLGALESTDGDTLYCRKGHSYIVFHGIPRMLSLKDEHNQDEGQRATALSFGAKWQSVPKYGIESGTRDFMRQWYLQRYGWESEQALENALRHSLGVLDAGMGIGRDVVWYGGMTEGLVVGIDLSESVEVAWEHVKGMPNVLVAQADIMKMPFGKEEFGFVVSDFVLHHTPDTRKALEALVSRLAVGGTISFYIYKKKGDVREWCDDRLREFTTKMSVDDCMKFSEAMAMLGRNVAGVSLDLQRVMYWEMFKCFWNPEFTLDANIAVNFDWYHPVYAWRHTPEEVRGWCSDLGIEVIHEDIGDSGISIRGIRR